MSTAIEWVVDSTTVYALQSVNPGNTPHQAPTSLVDRWQPARQLVEMLDRTCTHGIAE